jgi:hypothetical protein
MFSSEVLVRGGKSRRVAPRNVTAFDTDLRMPSATSRTLCRIIDISSGGARLRVYHDLAPETSIQLALPVKGLVDAHIVWANGNEAGCRFDQPLDDAVVTKLQTTFTERGTGS